MQNQLHKLLLLFGELSQKHNVINLAIGQPNINPPKEMIKAICEHSNKTDYTPILGLDELRSLITQKLKRENNVSAESVVVTSGAIEAIHDTMLAYLTRNSEVILFTPCYPKYRIIPEIMGANIKTIPLKNKRPDIDRLEKTASKNTTMIILNSPTNPSGIVYTRQEIKRITDIIDTYDILLVSDEVYEKYVYDGIYHVSPGQFSDNVITINSFSKTYSYPGLRIGYLSGKKTLVSPIIKVHQSNTTCSPYMAQQAAIQALQSNNKQLNISSFNDKRKLAIDKIRDAGLDYIHPQGTFYLYLYTKRNSVDFAFQLAKKNMLVMPGQFYEKGRNAVRLAYAVNQDMLKKGLETFIKECQS